MNVVISVVGKDQKGILAKVSTKCFENSANIIDVTQKVLRDYFTMVMIIEWDKSSEDFHNFINEMEALGESMNLKIHVMHEDIFNAMHNI